MKGAKACSVDDMRSILFLLLLIIWIAPCDGGDFASLADTYLVAKHGKFMGAVLVARDGKVLFEKGYGAADVAWGVLITPQTKFNVASLTKQFTGMAILQLAEGGKLDLDDPISKYYTNAPEAWEKITIYHLLSHRSGLPALKNLEEFTKGPAHSYTPAELIDTFRDKPLDFAPGTKWAYSNRGYYLLGYVIEQVSGQKYSDYLEQHIFRAIGMQDSGYDSTVAIIHGHAHGYAIEGQKLRYADYVDWSMAYAAGGLYSTVEDLLKWDQALYTEQLLSRKWLDRLFKPDASGYNYGWFINNKGGRLKMYHEGSNPGFAAFILRYPPDRTFVGVLSNLETAPVRQIASDLASLLFGEPIGGEAQ